MENLLSVLAVIKLIIAIPITVFAYLLTKLIRPFSTPFKFWVNFIVFASALFCSTISFLFLIIMRNIVVKKNNYKLIGVLIVFFILFDISSYYIFKVHQDVQSVKYNTYRDSFASNLPKVYNMLERFDLTNKLFSETENDKWYGSDSDYNQAEIAAFDAIEKVGENEIYLRYVQSLVDFDYPSQSVPLDIAMEAIISEYYRIIKAIQYGEATVDDLMKMGDPDKEMVENLFYVDNNPNKIYDTDFIIYKIRKNGEKFFDIGVVERISESGRINGTVITEYNVVSFSTSGNEFRPLGPMYLSSNIFTSITPKDEKNFVDYDNYKEAYYELKARSPY